MSDGVPVRRRMILAAVGLAALAAVLVPASASAVTPLRVRTAVARAANDLGWYRNPVTIKLWAVGPRGTVVTCRRESSGAFPNGTKISALSLFRGPVVRCRLIESVRRSSLSDSFLTITVGDGRSAVGDVSVNVDLEAPAITADVPSLPLSVSPVHLEGAASDGFSGVRRVMLEFSDELTQQEMSPTVAACPDCAKAPPCTRGQGGRNVCGSSVSWTFEGEVPPGVWSVTPVAVDLAGNETRGDPVQILVL